VQKVGATSFEAKDYAKVGVLLGGSSAERAVSLRSGEAIYQALLALGIDAVKIDPVDGLYQQLSEHKVKRAFIALHGRDGEDGVVQGFLKSLNIPFTGSDVASSAIAMNKIICKQVWQQAGLPTADFICVNKKQKLDASLLNKIVEQLGEVLFVKPVREGSSVGMSKVRNKPELIEALKLAHQYDDKALVEPFIAGKEYTVSVLEQQALPSISMQTPREFYDYKAKYESTQTQYFCPSGLTDLEEKQIADLALAAFDLIGCSGWGRVDFIRNGEEGEFLLLEANTVPGMTQTSLVPKAASAIGIEFNQLVELILQTSFSKDELASKQTLSSDDLDCKNLAAGEHHG
jgi:D-alanine-D-alanine ligase